MSIYFKFFLATLVCFIVGLFFWIPFMQLSFAEINTSTAILQSEYPSNQNVFVLQIAIGIIPILVLITSLLNKRIDLKFTFTSFLIILATSVITWQLRILVINLKIKRFESLASYIKEDVAHSVSINKFHLEYYMLIGLILGTLVATFIPRIMRKRMVT